MIRFTLDMPPTANKIWRKGKAGNIHKSSTYDTWLASAAWMVRKQYRGDPMARPVKVTIRAKRHHAAADLDNRIKPTLDALQKGGALLNDNFVHHVDAAWDSELEKGKIFATVEVISIPLEMRVAA